MVSDFASSANSIIPKNDVPHRLNSSAWEKILCGI